MKRKKQKYTVYLSVMGFVLCRDVFDFTLTITCASTTPMYIQYVCLRPPAEFKECFSLYDKKRRGKIDATDLITVMRCLGTSPTFDEIQRHLQVHKIGIFTETALTRQSERLSTLSSSEVAINTRSKVTLLS